MPERERRVPQEWDWIGRVDDPRAKCPVSRHLTRIELRSEVEKGGGKKPKRGNDSKSGVGGGQVSLRAQWGGTRGFVLSGRSFVKSIEQNRPGGRFENPRRKRRKKLKEKKRNDRGEL